MKRDTYRMSVCFADAGITLTTTNAVTITIAIAMAMTITITFSILYTIRCILYHVSWTPCVLYYVLYAM